MGMVVIFLFIFLFVGGSSGNGTGLGSRLEKRAPEPQLPRGCGLVQVATPSLGAPAAFVRMGELLQQVMERGKLFEEYAGVCVCVCVAERTSIILSWTSACRIY